MNLRRIERKKVMNLFSEDCYIHAHYRVYCPGCGGTRAIIALLHGRVLEAFRYNALVVVCIIHILVAIALRLCLKDCENRYKIFRNQSICSGILILAGIMWIMIRDYLLVYKGIDIIGDFI